MARTFLLIASLLMFLGVGLGAFGAHAWAETLAQTGRTGTFETAVRYQIYHALALLGVAWLTTHTPSPLVNWAGGLLASGVVLFSGSLYLLVGTNSSWLGAITPLGGVAFLGGWACLFMAVWRG